MIPVNLYPSQNLTGHSALSSPSPALLIVPCFCFLSHPAHLLQLLLSHTSECASPRVCLHNPPSHDPGKDKGTRSSRICWGATSTGVWGKGLQKVPKPAPGLKEVEGLDCAAARGGFNMAHDGFVGHRPGLRGWQRNQKKQERSLWR